MEYDPWAQYGHLSGGLGGQPPPPPPPPAPPEPRKRRSPVVTILAVTAAAALAALAIIFVTRSGGDDDEPAATLAQTTTTTAERQTTTTVAYKEPELDDFTLEVVTLSKECFGSAGCVVTYDVELTLNTVLLDPNKTYQVIYEVAGAEDGPQVNNLEVTGTSYRYDSGTVADTPSSDTVLTATVTSVRPLG